MAVKPRNRRGARFWVIDIQYRTPEGTKERYRRDAQVQTRAGADAEDRRLWAQIEKTGRIAAPTEKPTNAAKTVGITFEEAVNDWKARAPLKSTSKDGYMKSLNAYVLPRIGSKPIGGIDFGEFLTDLAAQLRVGREDQTLNNVSIAVRSVIRFRSRLGLMEQPRLPRLLTPKEKVFVPPTPEEVFAVLEAADAHVRLPISLASFAGLRGGEIRGLRRKDVDLSKDTLVVKVTLYKNIEDTPKSGHQRAVPIVEPLRSLVVAAMNANNKAERLCLSTRLKPWSDSGLRNAFHRAIDGANVPKHRLHDLRHFFITECFESNMSALLVQKLAGHQDLRVTQRYAHVRDGAMTKAMHGFETHLAKGRGDGNSVATEPDSGQSEPDQSSGKS